MAKTVVALYRDLSDAQAAVGDLLNAGVARERISLIRKDGRGDVSYDTSLGDPLQSSSTLIARDPNAEAVARLDDHSRVAVGSATGAVVGGTLGAFLAGVGALAIPGVGAVLGLGPLMGAILSGAGVGALSGGLLGSLVNSGVLPEHAEYYAEGIRKGGTLVAVHAEDYEADQCAGMLSKYGPLDVEQREDFDRQDKFVPGLGNDDADLALQPRDTPQALGSAERLVSGDVDTTAQPTVPIGDASYGSPTATDTPVNVRLSTTVHVSGREGTPGNPADDLATVLNSRTDLTAAGTPEVAAASREQAGRVTNDDKTDKTNTLPDEDEAGFTPHSAVDPHLQPILGASGNTTIDQLRQRGKGRSSVYERLPGSESPRDPSNDPDCAGLVSRQPDGILGSEGNTR